MMSSNEVKQRFTQVESAIHQAAETCRTVDSVPMDVKNYVQQLDQKMDQARATMQSQDENNIRQCIDDLEQLGDRAKDACERAGSVQDELKNAVMQAHRELSDMKHQLH